MKEARDMAEFACHPAALLSDGTYSVFAKYREAANRVDETPEHISCGGCLGSDEQVFATSRTCKARRCCL